jgi:hypothetical protein
MSQYKLSEEFEGDQTESKETCCLWGYRFTVRSEKKLAGHGLKVEDAMVVLAQQDFHAAKNGGTIARGECEKGDVVVVIRPIIGREPGDKAHFDVITAYKV